MPDEVLDSESLKKLAATSISDYDIYSEEARRFDWDMHVQIIGTMEAAIEALSSTADENLATVDKKLAKSRANFDHLTDKRVDILSIYGEQTRFVRNSALVSLCSRLYQALRRMANSAERFSPRTKGRYNDGRFGKNNEFKRLWNELEERFELDMVASSSLIEFVEPLVMARNQIVHEGSQVNVLWDDMTVDTTFSDAFPEYVDGTGMYVEVDAKEELLERNFEAATKLVKWVAEELRTKELATDN